jgi:hypothetical protein
MTRPVRNLDQIRSLLRQMDRSVDDARSRREGTPRAQSPSTSPPPNGNGMQQPPASLQRPPSPNGGSLASGQPSNGQRYPATNGNGSSGSSGNGGFPPMKPTSTSGNGSGSSNAPPRLKAKPKRSGSDSMPSGMNDPLQDFQQRQAS